MNFESKGAVAIAGARAISKAITAGGSYTVLRAALLKRSDYAECICPWSSRILLHQRFVVTRDRNRKC